ncbi:coiled-coil domain-containing protein 174 [Callorhinchus milii]|nr:coiled-coil domain-containing protein 174 [Callorhinchus milii]|eukprot:gi/632946676/ref/XP_007888674.1/ PREDICTED: coiled-coil domain-containing protein 174 [Callorhinchus milii]
MDKSKKAFNVTAASLVDLKAELYRKQEAFKREKLLKAAAAPLTAKSANRKPNIWVKANAGVDARAEKDVEEKAEEQQTLDKSKQKLEEKAKLYEQMTKGNFPDEETESMYLVDFTQKIFDKQKELRAVSERKAAENKKDEDTTTPESEIPPPQNPDEEWVDYVDSLGRSRRCMKKDMTALLAMDIELKGSRHKTEEKTLLSKDMRRELQREEWEKEEEEALSRPVGPLHYEDIREQEAREMGVGYYAFAREESVRKKQIETLDMLREQTMDQRSKREKLKEKRKAVLDARLAKIRQRKMKKLKGDGIEEDSELPAENNEGDEAELVGQTPAALEPTVSQAETPATRNKVDVVIEERKDSNFGLMHVREWDREKVAELYGRWPGQHADPREERPSEFAPPSDYHSDSKKPTGRGWTRSQFTQSTRMSGPRWKQDQPSHQTSETTPQDNSERGSRTQSRTLEDILSFYKHST